MQLAFHLCVLPPLLCIWYRSSLSMLYLRRMMYLQSVYKFEGVRSDNSYCTGVHDDDIVLSYGSSSTLSFLNDNSVITEKLDGGNCSIYRGKVS